MQFYPEVLDLQNSTVALYVEIDIKASAFTLVSSLHTSKYIAVLGNFLCFRILLKSRDQLFGQIFTWDSNHLLFHSREGKLFEVSVLLTKASSAFTRPSLSSFPQRLLPLHFLLPCAPTNSSGVLGASLSAANTFGFCPSVDVARITLSLCYTSR